MKLFSFFSVFVFSILLLGCKKERTYDDNLYVGAYMLVDRNMPVASLIEREGDSLYLINFRGEIRGRFFVPESYLGGNDTVEFFHQKSIFSNKYADMTIELFNQSANHRIDIHFFKAVETPKWDIEKVKSVLTKSPFTAIIPKTSTPNTDLEIRKTFEFSADSLKTTYAYYYNDSLMYAEMQTKKYDLTELRGKLFFSENEEDLHNPQRSYQIVQFDDNSFSIQYYQEQEAIIEQYNSAHFKDIPLSANPYTNCLESRPGLYYHDDITYTKGNDYIRERVRENAPKDKGNGYITVHFSLNCNGKIGRIGLEQMDFNYKSKSFSTTLIKHIIDEVVRLEDWPEIKASLFYRDIHAFLMFKIENGKITDLCP